MAKTCDERRADRQESIDSHADRLVGELQGLRAREDAISRHIPFGQPVLVGHYSEGRHRRDLAKIRGLADKQVAVGRELDAVAGAEATTAVMAGDVDAVDVLAAKLAKAEEFHAAMLARNKAERGSVEDWQLSNSSANIRRMRLRIEELKRSKAVPSSERMIGAVQVIEDTEAQRFRLIFPSKPESATIAKLKEAGFRWAPSEGAWQRNLSNAARHWGEQICKALLPADEAST